MMTHFFGEKTMTRIRTSAHVLLAGAAIAAATACQEGPPTGALTPGQALHAGRPSAPALVWSPATNGTFNYGTFNAGEAASHVFTLTNSGGSASGALAIGISGSAAFAITSDACTGIALGSGKSCTVTVRYTQAATEQSDQAALVGSSPKPMAANATLTLLGATRAAGHIFWTNSGAIGRANLDGSDVNQSFIAGSVSPYAIVADANYIYWVNEGATGSSIGRAKLDGSDVNANFITGLEAGLYHVNSLAVDASHIYWTKSPGTSIGRANLDGTSVNQSFISGVGYVGSLAVDGSAIYWAYADAANFPYVGRANLDGTGVQAQFGSLPNLPGIAALAVDGTHIYYLNGYNGSVGEPFIGQANRDWSDLSASLISLQNTCIVYFALDSSHFYWSCNGGVDESTMAIGRANRDGTGVNQNFIPAVGPTTGVAVSSR
jgi:virginiamycin B lyase